MCLVEFVLKLLNIDIPLPSPDPQAWDGLVADCIRCVHPIRQMLDERGVSDIKMLDLSDTACAAAVLARLWRDVRVDVFNDGRVYLPRDIAERHGLDLALMVKAVTLDTDRGCEGDQKTGSCDCASLPRAGMLAVRKPYRAAMGELVKRTDRMFIDNRKLLPSLPLELRGVYRRMTYEGRATLGAIAWQGYDTLARRASLGKVSKTLITTRLRWADLFNR